MIENLTVALQQLGHVKEYEPMKQHTTFRIGGPVRYAFYPHDDKTLMEAIQLAKEHHMEYKVVGRGSNLLWCDDPLDVIVIFLEQGFQDYEFQGDTLICGAGCSLIGMAWKAMEAGLSGLEFASGIPGSVGGAIYMNAGAYRSSMSDLVKEVQVLTDQGLLWLSKEELQFGYRYSMLKKHPDWVIIKTVLQLTPKLSADILELMESRKKRRLESQPLELPSAGSTFKNPQSKAAWQCIEEVDLRGHQIGGAQLSNKHCNFVVNAGNASASDVLELVELVQKKVYEAMAIELVMEVEQYQCQIKQKI